MNIDNEYKNFNLNYFKLVGGNYTLSPKEKSEPEPKPEVEVKITIDYSTNFSNFNENADNKSKVAIVDVLDSKLKLHTNDIIEDILFNGKIFR